MTDRDTGYWLEDDWDGQDDGDGADWFDLYDMLKKGELV